VERDSYKREIELVPGSEQPARLVLALARLYKGMQSIGVTETECWPLLEKIGMDCIPAIRRAVLKHLRSTPVASTTSIATELGYPTSTTKRALEDLTAHGVAEREKGSGADIWQLTDDAIVWWNGITEPEMSVEV
jgi:hypothetical protein